MATEETSAAPKAIRPPSASACDAALRVGCRRRERDRLSSTDLKSDRNTYKMSPESDTCVQIAPGEVHYEGPADNIKPYLQ